MKLPSFERIFWACILMVFGGLLLAQNLHITDFNIWMHIWKFWPIFFIIPAISSLIRKWNFSAFVLLLFGLGIIVSNFTTFNVWTTVWPLMIIYFGFTLIFKPDIFDRKNNNDDISSESSIEQTALFSGFEKKVESDGFLGGSVEVIFGGGKLDLRDIKIKEKIVRLDVNAVFGGCEILVNTDKYKVKSNGTAIFGSWVNGTNSSKVNSPVLEITGSAVFGGVEIK